MVLVSFEHGLSKFIKFQCLTMADQVVSDQVFYWEKREKWIKYFKKLM